MRRCALVLLAFVIVAMGAFVLPSQKASADTNCDAPFLDNTSRQVLRGGSMVRASIARLQATGADVRVRAFDSAPSGNLDVYRNQMIAACSSWGQGYMKSNLVIVIMSLDRQSAIYYGDDYLAAVSPYANSIRSSMGNYFRNNQFDQGIAYGLDQVNDRIGQFADRGESRPGEPVNLTVVAAMVVIFGTAALLIGGYFVVTRFRARSREIKAAKKGLAYAKQRADDAQLKLADVAPNDIDQQLLQQQLSDEDASNLDSLRKQLVECEVTAQQAKQTADGTAIPTGRALEPYQKQTEAYTAASTAYSEALAANATFTRFIAQKNHEIQQAGVTYTKLNERLTQAKSQLEDLQVQGFKFNHADLFEQAEHLLTIAKQEIDAKRAGQALDELQACPEILDAIERQLENGPQAFEEVTDRTNYLRLSLLELPAMIASAQQIYDATTAHFGAADTAELVDPANLSDVVAEAQQHLDDAVRFGNMKVQNWTNAKFHLAACQTARGKVEDSVQHVRLHANKLKRLEKSLPKEIEAARRMANVVRSGIMTRKGNQQQFTLAIENCLLRIDQLDTTDLLANNQAMHDIRDDIKSTDRSSQDENDRFYRERRAEEARQRREEERRREEEAEAERRRTATIAGTTGFGIGYGMGSSSSTTNSWGSSSTDFGGGGSSGSWGGSDSGGGGSSGSW